MRRIALSLSLLLAAGVAAAQDDDAESGPYLGVGAALAFEQFDLPYDVGAEDGFAWSLIGGYRLSPSVALELEGEVLTGFDLDGSIFGTPVSGEIDAWSLSANAKFFPIPPNDVIHPFLLAGVGWLDADGDVSAAGTSVSGNDSDWMFQVGGGIDFPVADRVTLELKGSYRFPQGDLDDFRFWTAGANLQYRF